MVKRLPLRQRVRKLMVIVAFPSFPITMNSLAPVLSMAGASEDIHISFSSTKK